MNLFIIIGLAALLYIIYRLLTLKERSRVIPEDIKRRVLERYFNMCAVCCETELLDFHHRQKFADGGDNSERNIVPLCPKHHAMVTRLENGK